MSDATTFEEAKQCPKCEVPGEDRKQEKALIRGATLHHIFCVNPRCKWYDTPWIVQVNSDGSIPPAADHTKSPKVYVGFEGHDAMAANLLKAIEDEKLASQERGTEIRRRAR